MLNRADMGWALKYVERVSREAEAAHPGDIWAQASAVVDRGFEAPSVYRKETGKEPPDELAITVHGLLALPEADRQEAAYGRE